MKGLFKTKRAPPQERPRSPIHIPEILERIVSFIDTPTDNLAVLQVCRDWHRMFRHLFVREVVVDYGLERQQGLLSSFSSKASTAALENLPTAGSLRWYDGFGRYYGLDDVDPHQKRRWQALVDALQRSHELNQWRQKQPSNPRLLLKDVSPLRHLEISGRQGLRDGFPMLLPFLGSLTRLCLQWGGPDASISMSDVFRSSPLLETVSFTTRGLLLVNGLESIPAGAPLRLRSLSLRRAHLLQWHLENLLSATPNLEALRLVDMRTNNTASALYSLSRLVQSLQNRSIRLSTFHVHPTAIRDGVLDLELSDVMYELDLTLTGWSFWGGDLTDKILSSLRSLHNVVTTLELHNIDLSATGPNCRLHQYLCESPHLLHLRAPRTAIMVEALDVHARSHIIHKGYLEVEKDKGKVNSDREWNKFRTACNHGQTRVWMCRKLRTLHCSIYSRIEPEFTSPARSRIVFGYFSRICPNLQDLQISMPIQHSVNGAIVYPKLDLRLEGGLCLLTRMRHLCILRLESLEREPSCRPKDLSWILSEDSQKETKESKQQRALRSATVEGWTDWLKTEETDDNHWRNDFATVQWRPKDDPVDIDEPWLKGNLKTMGLLLDVKLLLDEMDCPDDGVEYRCWPALRHISLNSPGESALSPEKEFRRLFPSRFDFIHPILITLLEGVLLIVQATPAASVIPSSHDDNPLPTTSTNVQAYDKNRTLSRMTALLGLG
ncbi:hypothetical protein EC957_008441 [Mortierella hygrophila]|uniref:F-box domain-containing protein n=1 Tax=Mortierella hygrophila TaxID=979708 RepID=A0A9P6FCW5_9FUNG|nr:hypothetical protein EC957_008441 [Mortierella hygrophila]